MHCNRANTEFQMSFMRIATILFTLSLLVSCKSSKDINGLWVGITEEGSIEITRDSIFIFNPFGYSLKSTYHLTGESICSGPLYFFTNEKFYDSTSCVAVKFRSDTLFWQLPDYPLQFVRSRFETYVEHYANSKELKIDLPNSDLFIPTDFRNYSYADLFIGYDKNGDVTMKLNDQTVISYDDLPQLLSIQKDMAEHILALRVFADRRVEMESIHELHSAMKIANVASIHYVTKPINKTLKNNYQNPYSNSFYGIKILIRETPTIKIIEDTTLNSH
jgi:biopolymer transport protein ExbD